MRWIGARKQVLGLWEGATENAAVCKALLADLIGRGLDTSEGILVVIDPTFRTLTRQEFGVFSPVPWTPTGLLRS